MPTLQNITCHVEDANNGLVPFREHTIKYADSAVECRIDLPSEPARFAINLVSNKFIFEGISFFVFIDGRYQCNRSQCGLTFNPNSETGLYKAPIQFRVRQKEEFLQTGECLGRDWTFKGICTDTSLDLRRLDQKTKLGTIEVYVLRCFDCKLPKLETTQSIPSSPSSGTCPLISNEEDCDCSDSIPSLQFPLAYNDCRCACGMTYYESGTFRTKYSNLSIESGDIQGRSRDRNSIQHHPPTVIENHLKRTPEICSGSRRIPNGHGDGQNLSSQIPDQKIMAGSTFSRFTQSHIVRYGKPYMYWHSIRRPRYLDTLHNPFAKFTFVYSDVWMSPSSIPLTLGLKNSPDQAGKQDQGENMPAANLQGDLNDDTVGVPNGRKAMALQDDHHVASTKDSTRQSGNASHRTDQLRNTDWDNWGGWDDWPGSVEEKRTVQDTKSTTPNEKPWTRNERSEATKDDCATSDEKMATREIVTNEWDVTSKHSSPCFEVECVSNPGRNEWTRLAETTGSAIEW